jgi:hypothetical protein
MKPTVLFGISAMAFSAALLFPPSLMAQSRGDEHEREGARHLLGTVTKMALPKRLRI